MASTSLEIVISAKDQFSGTANRVIGSLNQINTSASRVGRGVGQLAGGLSRLAFVAGGVAAAGLVASARAAISFEDAFAGVRKTADLTETEFGKLAASFRSMATEIPISANELAHLGEIAGALGISGVDNIREFSRVTALLGVTTDLSADQAATSLGHIATILQLTGKDYDAFADALVNLGNKGASTESQIAGIAERAAGGAATVGLATSELLAWSAAIANIGVEVEAGGTNFQKFLIEATKFAAEGGDELDTLAKVSGMTAKQWKADFGANPSSALSQFVYGLGNLNQEQQVLALGMLGWDDQRMARILLGLAANTDNLSDAFVNAGASAEGALSVEAQKRFDTLASKIKILKNNFVEAALTIGEGFTPALGRAVEKLTAFMGLDTTKTSLRKLGEDIGTALDNVDWQGILDGAKTFVGLLKDALSVLMALPDQIKIGGAALITAFNTPFIGPALGQVGKGLGNIGLGLLSGAGSLAGGKIGGLASLVAQPVRVVNWPLGFGMGGGGAAGGVAASGGGLLGKLVKGALGVTIVAMTAEAAFQLSGINDPRHQLPEGQTNRFGGATFRGTNVPSDQLAFQEQAAAQLRERIAGGETGIVVKQLAAVEAEIAKLRGDVQTQTTAVKSAGDRRVVPDLDFQSLADALTQTFGTHEAATGAFGSAQLKAFRGGDMSLIDERIKYLSGAQGSGAGSEGFLALVGRDIAALKTALPNASAAEAEKITAAIDILGGILEAKKFTITPAAVAAVKEPKGSTESDRAQNAMATLPQVVTDSMDRTRSAVDLARMTGDAKADATRAAIQALRLTSLTNVTVNLSARDVQTTVATTTRVGPATGSSGKMFVGREVPV